MRSIAILFIFLCTTGFMQAQDGEVLGWFIDDFKSTTFDQRWHTEQGNWGLDEEYAVVKFGAGVGYLANEMYIMRTKPYTIDAMFTGSGGGIAFCLEDYENLRNGHLVYMTGSQLSIGYLDYHGEYVETRTLTYAMTAKPVQLQIIVDPVERRFKVKIFERDVALEELRFQSGHFGLYAEQSDVSFDYVQVLATERIDEPPLFVKSNNVQIDHVQYIALQNDALLVANPVVGIVQRVTSRGSFVTEYQIPGVASEPRGMFLNEKGWLYIVDGGQNNVRVFNENEQLELIIGGDLKNPVGVVTDPTGTHVKVLDQEGIKIFDEKGNLVEVKARGMFKNPKNMYRHGDMIYVADHDNGRVVMLDRNSYQVVDEIKENLVNPWDVFVEDETGEIFVADPGAEAVFHYSKEKTFLERIDPVTIRGFISPRGVRVNNDMIYVADFERILGFKKGVLTIRPTFRIEN